MCGIAGFWPRGFNSEDAFCDVGLLMADSISRRGPDDTGVWVEPVSGVTLAHRRLAVVDLSPAGHQPMHSSTGRYTIVYNGEIYNHLALRQELEHASTQIEWRGHSDTETLLECIEVWGVSLALKKSVGMFALALWDNQDKTLCIARDRLGEKPLYYGWSGGSLVFGSELSSLRQYPEFDNKIDRNVVALYLQYAYVPAPYSIYRGIYKLEPGCALTINPIGLSDTLHSAPFSPFKSRGISIERYWSLGNIVAESLDSAIENDEEAVIALENALQSTVEMQSIADVALGAFLSGGVDSSTIVALMQEQSSQQVQTFTIGFDQLEFNEADYAKSIANYLGTYHTEFYVSAYDTQNIIPLLSDLYSEPFADASQIPTYILSKLTRESVTVSLSGDGGDELFCGYNRYLWGKKIWNKLSWIPAPGRRTLGRVVTRIDAKSWDRLGQLLPKTNRVNRLGDKAHKLAARLQAVNGVDALYRSLVTDWAEVADIVPNAIPLRIHLDDRIPEFDSMEPEHRMMFWDTLSYLPDDILQKVDRASMGVSLETRVPFLDHRIVELAWRLPLHMKLRGNESKWILRQILYKRVPRKLIERPKAGFGIPVGQWLRGPLREWAESLISETRLKADGLLSVSVVRTIWYQHLAGTHDWTSRLWSILMLQAWLDSIDGTNS